MKNFEIVDAVEHLHEPQQVMWEHQLQQVVWIIEVSAKYLRHQAYHRRAAGPAQSMQKFEDLKAELSMAFHGLEVRGLQALTGAISNL